LASTTCGPGNRCTPLRYGVLPTRRGPRWRPKAPIAATTAMLCCYRMAQFSHWVVARVENGTPLPTRLYPTDPVRDNHMDAQIFKPPYLFNGEPPEIVGILAEVKYGQSFIVTVNGDQSISRISWIRLPSGTHGLNSSQSVVFRILSPPQSSPIEVTAPKNRNAATPGHYMLFFENTQGRPSVASIIRISPERTPEERTPQSSSANSATAVSEEQPAAMMMAQPRSLPHSKEKVVAERGKHAVKIGLTPVCPYGLGMCWAGAFEGLLWPSSTSRRTFCPISTYGVKSSDVLLVARTVSISAI